MLNKAFICADCSDSFKEGWATILKDNQLYTYCCYSCYQSNPIIVPTESKFKSSNEKVVLPTIIDTNYSFEFLTETEINQLTNDEYKSYKEQIDNQFLLNPVDKDVHYSILEDDRLEKELEDEFYNSLSDDDAYDDY
tara:strand:- start:2963 stop:3373 length:411 start_codon:yes stop_codon:yes gene_type:complete